MWSEGDGPQKMTHHRRTTSSLDRGERGGEEWDMGGGTGRNVLAVLTLIVITIPAAPTRREEIRKPYLHTTF